MRERQSVNQLSSELRGLSQIAVRYDSQHNYRGIVRTEHILERRPYVYCVTTIESHAAIKLIKYVLVARKL